MNHVKSCFDNEKTLIAAINACQNETELNNLNLKPRMGCRHLISKNDRGFGSGCWKYRFRNSIVRLSDFVCCWRGLGWKYSFYIAQPMAIHFETRTATYVASTTTLSNRVVAASSSDNYILNLSSNTIIFAAGVVASNTNPYLGTLQTSLTFFQHGFAHPCRYANTTVASRFFCINYEWRDLS